MRREPLAPGTALGDRYRIVRPLAHGAMGAVYVADAEDGAQVALKTLFVEHGRGSREMHERFLREAAVCAHLRHPNVVPVLDHGIDEDVGLPYLVMPLLRGEDLGSALARTGALEPDVAVVVAVQAARGLRAAHAAGIVHRDVKPSNLFLGMDDCGQVRVQIADFGVAKVLDGADTLTASGAFMGTPYYMSPEQATSAKKVDARADVWSLGMTLYHALTGDPAFARPGAFMAFVLDVRGADVRPIQDVAPWVPPALARVVHGARLRQLEVRCPSVAELELALETACGIDVCDGPLTGDSFRPVSPETRARVAPRAELPESWDKLLRID